MDKLADMSSELDINVKDLIGNILHYKRSIFSIVVIMSIIGVAIIYFKTPIYTSNAIIEVKSEGQQGIQSDDFLGSTFANFGNEKVDKEIEILKTFFINNHALSKVNFNVQYYIDEGFKKVEIYRGLPLVVKNLTILDENIIGRLIKIIPQHNGYRFHFENSYKDKLLNLLLGRELINLNDQKIYEYGKNIKTKYFELEIIKKSETKESFYLVLKGDNRQIYESIKDNLQINQINPSTPLVGITYKDTIPDRANTYVNTLMESFIHQSIAEKSKQNDRIINFINDQLANIKIKLDNSEKKLEKYRIKYHAINPTLQAETYITELSQIEIELSKNELNAELIDNLVLFSKTNKNLDAIAPSLAELKDESTLELITKLQEVQIREEGLKTQYSGKHPELIAARKQNSYIKKKIILNLNNLKTSIIHRNNNLLKLKKSYDKKIESLPTQERTLINLRRNYEVSSETYRYLLKKKSENEMIKVAILSDYRIIEKAYSNSKPLGPKNMLIVFGVIIIGLIIGIIQALIRTFLDNKIKSKDDIERQTTLPIYGIIPMLKSNSNKLEVYANPKSPFSESFRSLRTNLQFSSNTDEASVALLTSTIAGEGKSTIVANLGAVFQMANYKSIVIDLDLRKSTLHHYFELDNNLGMSTYLSGKNSSKEIIQMTMYNNLDIITSGPIPPNPSELILSDRLEQLINSLKKDYDYIFIDTAPVGLVADTMHLMQFSDINLIVFRENYANKSFISDLNKLQNKHDFKHIGIVLNAASLSSRGYGYGYGYGYGD